jgi:hypothetical protein
MATINQAKHFPGLIRRATRYIETAVQNGIMTAEDGEFFIKKLQVRTIIVGAPLTIGDASAKMKLVDNGDLSIDKNDMFIVGAEALAYRTGPTANLIYVPSETSTVVNRIFWNGHRGITIGSSKVFHSTSNEPFLQSGVETELGANFRECAVNYIVSGQSSITAEFKGVGDASKVKGDAADTDELVYLLAGVVIEGAAQIFNFGTNGYAVLPM